MTAFINISKSGEYDALLLESGDYLLLESGDKILLEAHVGNWSNISRNTAAFPNISRNTTTFKLNITYERQKKSRAKGRGNRHN